jgi:hypothetical protein
MTFGRLALLVGVALLVLVANSAVSILYMVVYGYVIDAAGGTGWASSPNRCGGSRKRWRTKRATVVCRPIDSVE